MVTDLLVDEGIVGVLALDQTSGKWTAFTAKALILATGGAAANHVRNAGRNNPLAIVKRLVAESSQAPQPVTGSALIRAIECRSALRVAGWILEAALKRCESRGSHFREDFPQQDDAQWLGHLQVFQGSTGKDIWHFERSKQSGTVQK